MSRIYEAGLTMGRTIIEMLQWMNAWPAATDFYKGLFAALGGEFDRRNITSKCSGRDKDGPFYCTACGMLLNNHQCPDPKCISRR